MRIHLLASLLNILALPGAWAWPPTFGTEFNFSNSEIENAFSDRLEKMGDAGQRPSQMEHGWVKKFAEAVAARCGIDCEVIQKQGKFGFTEYLVKFKNGWEFNVSVDPSVVEIQTKPETLEELGRNAEMYQKYIFEVAQGLGLSGDGNTAHFNIGTNSFSDGDVGKFLRFYLDYSSNTALAEGIFGRDFDNAPPFATIDAEGKAAMQRLLEDWRAGKVTSVRSAAERIHREVYARTASRFENVAHAAYHYQAVGLKAIVGGSFPARDAPTELRAVRHPESVKEYILLAELIQKRMEYLERVGMIPRVPRTEHRLFHENEIYNRFVLYVREMGLDPERYRSLLGDEFSRSRKPDAFMAGDARLRKSTDLKVVSNYLKDYPDSPFVLEQFGRIINLDRNKNSKEAEELLREIVARAEREPELRASARAFLESLQTTSWAKVVEQMAWAERLPVVSLLLPPKLDAACVARQLGEILGR